MKSEINMTPSECINGLREKNQLLTAKNQEYIKLYKDYADAQRNYKIALASKITRLKIDGHPVSIINQLAAGDKIVADLGYKMNVAEGIMKACRESMRDIAGSIDTYRSVLTWLREELHRG